MRVVGEERVQAFERDGIGVILVTWHGRTLVPITRFRNRGYWAMISTSRDGEYQNRLFQRFGWQTVRGSTSARGAVQAALTMVKHLKAGGDAGAHARRPARAKPCACSRAPSFWRPEVRLPDYPGGHQCLRRAACSKRGIVICCPCRSRGPR